MILLLPSQSDEKAHAELAAIREAGRSIAASPERRRAFLSALGFGSKKKPANGNGVKRPAKSQKQGA